MAKSWSFVLTFKPGRTPSLWKDFEDLLKLSPDNRLKAILPDGTQQLFGWVNDLDCQDDEDRWHKVNALLLEETSGEQKHTFAWITDLPLRQNTVCAVAAQGGRVRSKIENQGFNLQKNPDASRRETWSTPTASGPTSSRPSITCCRLLICSCRCSRWAVCCSIWPKSTAALRSSCSAVLTSVSVSWSASAISNWARRLSPVLPVKSAGLTLPERPAVRCAQVQTAEHLLDRPSSGRRSLGLSRQDITQPEPVATQPPTVRRGIPRSWIMSSTVADSRFPG